MTGAVIFDMDGVLVDSEPYWREGFREAVEVIADLLGVAAPPLSDADLMQYEGGRVPDTVRTLAVNLFGEVPEETVEQAVRAAVERATTLFDENPRTHEATVRTAADLHERGFRLAVASSSAPEFIEAVLKRVGLADRVDVVESAFHLDHAKPHPEVYLNAVRELALPAERCTAVEDSWTGVESALRAGLRTVWLTEESEDAAQVLVKELWEDDAARSERPPPSLMLTQALDADAVEKFSEA